MATINDNHPHKDIHLKSFIQAKFFSSIKYKVNDNNIMTYMYYYAFQLQK